MKESTLTLNDLCLDAIRKECCCIYIRMCVCICIIERAWRGVKRVFTGN